MVRGIRMLRTDRKVTRGVTLRRFECRPFPSCRFVPWAGASWQHPRRPPSPQPLGNRNVSRCVPTVRYVDLRSHASQTYNTLFFRLWATSGSQLPLDCHFPLSAEVRQVPHFLPSPRRLLDTLSDPLVHAATLSAGAAMGSYYAGEKQQVPFLLVALFFSSTVLTSSARVVGTGHFARTVVAASVAAGACLAAYCRSAATPSHLEIQAVIGHAIGLGLYSYCRVQSRRVAPSGHHARWQVFIVGICNMHLAFLMSYGTPSWIAFLFLAVAILILAICDILALSGRQLLRISAPAFLGAIAVIVVGRMPSFPEVQWVAHLLSPFLLVALLSLAQAIPLLWTNRASICLAPSARPTRPEPELGVLAGILFCASLPLVLSFLSVPDLVRLLLLGHGISLMWWSHGMLRPTTHSPALHVELFALWARCVPALILIVGHWVVEPRMLFGLSADAASAAGLAVILTTVGLNHANPQWPRLGWSRHSWFSFASRIENSFGLLTMLCGVGMLLVLVARRHVVDPDLGHHLDMALDCYLMLMLLPLVLEVTNFIRGRPAVHTGKPRDPFDGPI